MSFSEIENKINDLFKESYHREIIFWYDKNQEFKEEIANLNLIDAELFILKEDNWIECKYIIEFENKDKNFLVYAPFAQPSDEENYLADMVHYATPFSADKNILLAQELNIPNELFNLVSKYSKFFNANSRINAFKSFNIQSFKKSTIILAILAVLSKQKTINFDYILRAAIKGELYDENIVLNEFNKYDILDDFWKIVAIKFNYIRDNPTMDDFICFLLINYTSSLFNGNTPKHWDKYLVQDNNNAYVFIDEFMNNNNFTEAFDELSLKYQNKLKITNFNSKFIDSYCYCDSFEIFDKNIISHYIDLLYHNKSDLGSDFKDILEFRMKTHFYSKFENKYLLLRFANLFITLINDFERSSLADDADEIIEDFASKWSYIDGYYRKFYYHYDKIDDTAEFEDLRQLIENMYVNSFLMKINVKFSKALQDKSINNLNISKQWRFYKENIIKSFKQHKTAVIISDGFRYGCAVELLNEFDKDPKRNPSLKPMISTIPSYTALGMASLLPHKEISYLNDTLFVEGKRTVLVDGKKCATTSERDSILKEHNKTSLAITYDEFTSLKLKELKELFKGINLIYIYHNKIDSTGDKAISQHNVFKAANGSIEDMVSLVTKLSHLNFSNIYITSDHGFIYKRDKLEESSKMNLKGLNLPKNKRYILSNEPLNINASINLPMDYLNIENLYVNVPLGTDLFKAPGNGLNYVHGGASLEECIVPLLHVKADKGAKNQHKVKLNLISTSNKITNTEFMLTFSQEENISQNVLPLNASIYFVDEYGEKISNEINILADKNTDSSSDREFKEKFTLQRKTYDSFKNYYLVICDMDNDLEILREKFIIDMAFQDDFEFF